MTYCNGIVEHFAHIDGGFPSTNTSVCGMQQVFQDRTNEVRPQDNILQTPSAKFVALAGAFAARENVVRAEALEPSWAV